MAYLKFIKSRIFINRGRNILLLLLILISSLLAAQPNSSTSSETFSYLSEEDGLSNGTVNCILQDSKGFIWFGTNDGLNKYDGLNFTVYRHQMNDSNSVSNNTIWRIIEDSKGFLWIGTKGGGLNRFNPVTENFVRFKNNPSNPSSLCNNYVIALCDDQEGNLWIGTDGGGMDRISINDSTQKTEFIHYCNNPFDENSLSGNEILSICKDWTGNLWIGTWNKGLNRYDSKTGEFKRYTNTVKHSGSILSNNIWTIFEDNDRNLWIGSFDGGLCRYQRDKDNFKEYILPSLVEKGKKVSRIWSISDDRAGGLWLGTQTSGLLHFDYKKNNIVSFHQNKNNDGSLNNNNIIATHLDDSGFLWVGTSNTGINVLIPKLKEFNYCNIVDKNKITSIKNVYAFVEDGNGIIWIGSTGTGLTKIDFNTGKTFHYANDPANLSSLSDNNIKCLKIDSRGILWAGTWDGGLNRFNPKTNTFTRFMFQSNNLSGISNNHITAIEEDPTGNLWIGTDKGLNYLNYETETFTTFYKDAGVIGSLSSNHVLSICVDTNQNVWIGTWAGLNLFNKKTQKFIRYIHDGSGSISNDYINFITESDSKEGLWIGTREGLNYFDFNTFYPILKANGLQNDEIHGILNDENGNVWVSTNIGISKITSNFDDKNRKSITIKNFDTRDGLKCNKFNNGACMKTTGGVMFFGGVDGFNSFIPDEILLNPSIPEIIITDFTINNQQMKANAKGSPLKKHISETTEIVLNHKQSVFSFQFVALNYFLSQKNQFAYCLQGWDKEFIYCNNRTQVDYTNVPAGEYLFQVIGSNNDNIWNETGTSIKITILPPFWETTWFRILLLSFVMINVFSIFTLRISSIKKQKKRLEVLVDKRTNEVTQQKDKLAHQASILEMANLEILNKNKTLEKQTVEIEQQKDEIEKINLFLKEKNIVLTKNVKEISQARIMQKQVSFDEFKAIYPDEQTCRKFLSELKWKEGFHCRKCGHTGFIEDGTNNARRCNKCWNNESVTVGTIFYRIKFPLLKAFYITFLVSTGKPFTVDELSKLVSIRRGTGWSFRNKVKELMKEKKQFNNPKEGWKELVLLNENSTSITKK